VSRANVQTLPAEQYGELIAKAKQIMTDRGMPVADEDRKSMSGTSRGPSRGLKRVPS